MDPHPIPTTQWRRTVRRTHAHTHTHTHEQTTSIPERAPETAAAQTLVNRGGEERKTRRVQPSAYEGRYLERQTPVKEDEGLRARESPRRFIYRYCCAPPFLPAAHHPSPAANPPPPRLLLPMQHVPSPTLDWRRAAPVVLRPAVFHLSRSTRTTFERSVTRARRPFLSATFRKDDTWLVVRMGLSYIGFGSMSLRILID